MTYRVWLYRRDLAKNIFILIDVETFNTQQEAYESFIRRTNIYSQTFGVDRILVTKSDPDIPGNDINITVWNKPR